MKRVCSFIFAAVSVFFCGCRSQIVTVDIVPHDARVIANGVEYYNHSPLFIEASTGRQLMITAFKDGYRDKIHVVDYELSSMGKAFAWTSILVVPAFGLLFDNSWTLKENNVSMFLEPLTPEAKAEAEVEGPRVVPLKKSLGNVDQTTDPSAKKTFEEL